MNIVSVYGLDHKKEKQRIGVPKDSRILSVCVKQEHIYVSVEHDANMRHYGKYQAVEFAIFKDGRVFYTDDYQFLGTVVMEFGNTIFQVFYRNV